MWLKVYNWGIILFAGALALGLSTTAANAAMPPETYAGPLGARIATQARCTFGNLDAGHTVLPRFLGVSGALVAGQYVNPTTCKVEGAPAGPKF